MKSKTLCSNQTFIRTVEECKRAALILSIRFNESVEWRSPFNFGGCLVAKDGRDMIYFNNATDLSTTPDAMHAEYHAICRSEKNTYEDKGQECYHFISFFKRYYNKLLIYQKKT